MEFSIKDFFSKCKQILSFLQISSHFLKKSLMENFIFWGVFLAGTIAVDSEYWTEFQPTQILSSASFE